MFIRLSTECEVYIKKDQIYSFCLDRDKITVIMSNDKVYCVKTTKATTGLNNFIATNTHE